MTVNPNVESTTSSRYTFWLSWPKDIDSLFEIVKCVIDDQQLVIYSNPPQHIGVKQILKCKVVAYGYRYGGHKVQLEVVGGSCLYVDLTPLNPLHPQTIGDYSEAKALANTIQGFKLGSRITLDPNPYTRKMAYLKWRPKVGETWDANISPQIYYRVRYEPTCRKIFFFLGALVVLLLLILVLDRVFF